MKCTIVKQFLYVAILENGERYEVDDMFLRGRDELWATDVEGSLQENKFKIDPSSRYG